MCVRVCVCVCVCVSMSVRAHAWKARPLWAARGPLAAGLRSLSPQVLSEGALGPRAGEPRGGRGPLGIAELLVWYLAHTPSGWSGAGWCVRDWGWGAHPGRPRARPLPPPQDTQKIHEAAPTLVQTCAESHAWRHAPRSMRTRGPTAWPGVRRHVLRCALLDGLEEGRHVEHPPSHAFTRRLAPPLLLARVCSRWGTRMPARSRSTRSSGSLTWTTPTLGLSTHPSPPALPHLTLVRRARRYANNPARSGPTHWHTALLIYTRRTHPGTHTWVPSAGRPAGGPRTGRPNAPRRRLSACPSTRGPAVVNDAFDGGRICCARSERAPIIWKAEIRSTIYSAALWRQFPNPVQPHSRAASGSRADNDWLFIIFAGNKD